MALQEMQLEDGSIAVTRDGFANSGRFDLVKLGVLRIVIGVSSRRLFAIERREGYATGIFDRAKRTGYV